MFTVTKWHINPVNLLCLAMLAILLVISLTSSKPQYTPHRCIDSTHQACDGNCECDGLGCEEDYNYEANKPVVFNPQADPLVPQSTMRAYQVSIEDKANLLLIWDGKRLVGTIPFTWSSLLGRMVMIDND